MQQFCPGPAIILSEGSIIFNQDVSFYVIAVLGNITHFSQPSLPKELSCWFNQLAIAQPIGLIYLVFICQMQWMLHLVALLYSFPSMDFLSGKGLPKHIQTLIRGHVELECFLCMGQFDTQDYAPMMMCMNQHSCCAPCLQELFKGDANKLLTCPHCHALIVKKAVAKNRLLIAIHEIVSAFKKHVSQLQQELDSLRKVNTLDVKASLLSKNPRMASSFILGLENTNYLMRDSTMLQEFPMSKSSTWVGGIEKRRENLLAYAEREKIEEIKKIAKSDLPFDQVTKIRSGYGCIKKIECMEYFTNLRELMLYNNNIKTIEGLNNNIKLNVLSLAYNKIEKSQNLGHLKELKRLSLECNKLGRSSAEYMTIYDWKNLESLTISFHEESKEDNDDCYALLFGTQCTNLWQSLKTLYIYSSKNVGERGRAVVKEFAGRRKAPLQVYWS